MNPKLEYALATLIAAAFAALVMLFALQIPLVEDAVIRVVAWWLA